MAYSTQTVVSDGTLVLLDISIEYLERTEITVYFNSVPITEGAGWSWVGTDEKRLAFSPAVTNGVSVLVKRTTDISEIRHNFTEGAAFTSQTLDEDLEQVLHIAQEAVEGNLSADFFSNIRMHGNKVTQLGTAVDPTDAISLGQATSEIDAGVADATAQAAAALASATLAQQWATYLAGTVDGSGYSARYWANQAAASAAAIPSVPFPIASGGTGGTTQNAAQVGLGLLPGTDIADITGATGSVIIPSGSTAQRDVSPASGYFRLNTTLNRFEGYKSGTWGSVGGGATGGGADEVFVENSQQITTNYIISTGKNAMATGPVTIQTGVTVEVPSGQTLVIL